LATGSIKFGGLASGIDTTAIIAALMGVERLPVKRMEQERVDVVKRQSLIRDLNTMLLELRESARGIDNRSDSLVANASKEELLATSAKSSDATILDASSSGSAAPGTYSVRVEALATAARRVSAAYGAATDLVGQAGDTLSIAYGGAAAIDLTLDGTESLQDVADLVNESANNDGSVRASILDDGQGGFRLVLSGADVGADDDVTVTTSLVGPLAAPFIDPTRSQSATNARLVVFGTTITRDTNEVSDVVPGVTLKLSGTNDPNVATDAVTVTVSRDGDAIAGKLQTLVDAYNKLREFALRQSTYDSVNKKAGPLSGDVGVRLAERAAQDALTRSFSFPGNPLTSLSGIGIEFETGGKLSLDRVVLDAALARDPDSVRELLSGNGTTDGAATALARALEPVVRTGDGMLAQRLGSIDDEIRGIDGRIERAERRLDAVEESLTRRFTALEQLISNFQSSSGFLDRIAASNTRSR
jgi:flagellar hook-associated protein 2